MIQGFFGYLTVAVIFVFELICVPRVRGPLRLIGRGGHSNDDAISIFNVFVDNNFISVHAAVIDRLEQSASVIMSFPTYAVAISII